MSEGMMRYVNADKLPTIKEPTDEVNDKNVKLVIPKITLTPPENGETITLFPDSEGSVDNPSTEEPTVEEDMPLGLKVNGCSTEADSIVNENNGLYRRNMKVVYIMLILPLITIIFSLVAERFHSSIYYVARHRPGQGNKAYNLMLVNREMWDPTNIMITDKWAAYQAKRVVITQTETTKTCESLKDCAELLKAVKEQEDFFKYNFLLALDGHVYETLGWQERSPLYSDTPTMVIALIGDYEERAPSEAQLAQLKILLDISLQLQYLSHSYTIHGRKMDKEPKKLNSYIAKLKKWEKEPYGNANDNNANLHPQINLLPYFEL